MDQPPPLPPTSEQRLEANRRHAAIFFEHTRSFAEALQYGLSAESVFITPTTIETYRGEIQILEAWIEQRPHKEVKAQGANLVRKNAQILDDHIVLNLRIASRTPEDTTLGGVWFTNDKEWHGFSWNEGEVRSFRFMGSVPSDIHILISRIEDLDLNSRPIRPRPSLALQQTFILKK